MAEEGGEDVEDDEGTGEPTIASQEEAPSQSAPSSSSPSPVREFGVGDAPQAQDTPEADMEVAEETTPRAASPGEEDVGTEDADGEAAGARSEHDDSPAAATSGFRPQPPPGEKPPGRRPSANVTRGGSGTSQGEPSLGDGFSMPEMAGMSSSPYPVLPPAAVDTSQQVHEPPELVGGTAADGVSSIGADGVDLQLGGPTPELPEEALRMDSIEWRREYNIRRREEAWRQRADAMLMQKRVTWEVHRLEKQNRIAASREAAARCALELRIREENEQVEREYKTRCRDIQIQRRYNLWTKRVADEVTQKVEDARQIEEADVRFLKAKKEQMWEQSKEAARHRAEAAQCQADRDALREEKISQQHQVREKAAAADAQRLKAEAQDRQQKTSASFPARPKSTRCCLVLPEKVKTEAEKECEALRSANLARKEQKRNQQEVQRYTALNEKEAQEGLLVRFKGPTEHAILLGKRSIFQ